MKEQDIDYLVEDFKKNDQSAFRKIYEAYYRRIFRFARSFLDLEDAEDITANTFIKLWERRSTFETSQHIQGFLLVTVRNGCLDVLQREKYARIYKERVTKQHSKAMSYDVESIFLKAEIKSRIVAELDKLPPRTKRVCYLAYFEGLKNEEISQLVGIKYQTVCNMKLVALKKLRVALQKEPLFFLLMILLRK
jgi:RNA polymerase sigma-70 factor (family 1)